MVLVYSARRWSRRDLPRRADRAATTAKPAFSLVLTLTRETTPMPLAPDRPASTGRWSPMRSACSAARSPTRTFVCGATAFVEVAAMFLIEAGLPFASIRTERYGGAPPPSLDAETVAPEV